MTTMLKKPNEDEHLVGVLVDYALDMGVGRPWAFLHRTLGYRPSAIADLPGGLDRIAHETFLLWELTAADIRDQCTTFPYFVASCSEDVANRVAAAMNRAPAAPRNRCSLGFGRFVRQRAFRYCGLCAAEDRASKLRPYCRRAHQLPGVVVCHKHGCLLHESPVLTQRPFETAMQNRGICRDGMLLDVGNVGPASLDIMRCIAVNSARILESGRQREFYENQKRYREDLEIRGYSLGENLVQLDQLSADVVAMFDASYLECIGLYRKGQGARDWLVPLLCKGQAVPPTVSHVLLQTFLEFVDKRVCAKTAGADHAPAIRCPALDLPNVTSDNEHKVLRVRMAGDRGSAVCSCDTAFKFTVAEGQRKIDRIVRLGKPYKQYAQHLYSTGLGYREIAGTMSISTMSVRRMLSEHKEPASDFDIEMMGGRRGEWKAIFESGCTSLVEARRSHRKLYRSLLTHDRKWFDEFCLAHKASSRTRVDWPARDAEYSTRLRTAAEELWKASPPRCVSTISILFVAGVKLGTRNQLAKLPRCRRVLEAVVESSKRFRQRVRG